MHLHYHVRNTVICPCKVLISHLLEAKSMTCSMKLFLHGILDSQDIINHRQATVCRTIMNKIKLERTFISSILQQFTKCQLNQNASIIKEMQNENPFLKQLRPSSNPIINLLFLSVTSVRPLFIYSSNCQNANFVLHKVIRGWLLEVQPSTNCNPLVQPVKIYLYKKILIQPTTDKKVATNKF